MINPQGGGPTFQRIAADLRTSITGGQLRPGQWLPSETRLSQQYGVSRLTARAAVNVLRAEGLAELVTGRGVVVREPLEREDLRLPEGASAVARMPTAEERTELDIAEGVPLLSVTAPDGTVSVYPADRWRLRSAG